MHWRDLVISRLIPIQNLYVCRVSASDVCRMNRCTLVPNLLWSFEAPITAKNGDARNAFWTAAVLVVDIAGGRRRCSLMMCYGGLSVLF